MPDLRGAYLEEAEMILKKNELYPQVIDSVYTREKELGTVVDQIPAPNSTMKPNRPVYLIINSRQVRTIKFPDVSDYSSRQATAMLQASGIEIESVQYIPSLYRDLVLDVKYKGETIEPGTEIPEGDAVVLIVGNGLGDEEVAVPNVRGLTLDVARKELMNFYFTLGAVNYDVEPQEEGVSYFIYRQYPVAGRKVPSGTRVDVWLSADPSSLQVLSSDTDATDNLEEEFF